VPGAADEAELKRRTNYVGVFANDAAITRLVGAMMIEQNDEWSLNRRCIGLEGLQTLSDASQLGCWQCRAEHVKLNLSGEAAGMVHTPAPWALCMDCA